MSSSFSESLLTDSAGVERGAVTEEGSSCGELVPAVVLSPSCTLSCCPATLASSEPGGAPDLGAAAIVKRSAQEWSQSYKLHTDLFNILDSILIRSKEERLGFHSPDPSLIRPSLLLLLLLSTPGTSLLGLWCFTNAVGCCFCSYCSRPLVLLFSDCGVSQMLSGAASAPTALDPWYFSSRTVVFHKCCRVLPSSAFGTARRRTCRRGPKFGLFRRKLETKFSPSPRDPDPCPSSFTLPQRKDP